MIDYSLIKMIPATDSDREFSYQVKNEAEREYIIALFGWDEKLQREFHTKAWQEKRPDIITFKGEPIGTIAVTENENEITIGQILFCRNISERA